MNSMMSSRGEEKAPTAICVKFNDSIRFDLETEENRKQMVEHLDKYGYAVIASVVPQDEIPKAKSLFWEYMEERTSVKRDDVRTWRGGGWLPDEVYGLMSHGQFNQSPYMWKLRMQSKVKLAFQTVWDNNDDLLVSFDGGNAFRPWKYDATWLTEGGWWHVDQGLAKKGQKVCVQGLVNLYDATAESGGLCVIPGSHKMHDVLCERIPGIERMEDFCKIPKDDEVLLKSADAIMVGCKAGDMIIWDSRTIHCNSPALTEVVEEQKADLSEWDLIRMVGYICMTPASMADTKTIQRRLEVFTRSGSTNHWPHECHILGLAPKRVADKNINDLPLEQQHLIIGKTPRLS
jgi:hypothetical protein